MPPIPVGADSQVEARFVTTIRSVVLRPALFVAACALLWGSLIAGVFLWRLLTSGVAAATAPFSLVDGADPWAWWANLVSGLGAAIFWVLIAGLVLASRSAPPPESET
jgi:hypothetical protein